MVWVLFFSHFWRWMVVHMWVEVTFEVFTTVIIAFLYREMCIISKAAAMLFFLQLVLHIIFCWIAKTSI